MNVSTMFPAGDAQKRNFGLTAAVLAGGVSARMGVDKAALVWEGRTLLERAVQAALAAELPTLVIGRTAPPGWSLPEVTFLPDRQPGLGPLGGLQAALRHAGAPVLALACDLPLLTPDALRWLTAQAAGRAETGPTGVIVVNGEQWEPLFSVYSPACLEQIDARLSEGRRSLQGLIKDGQFLFAQAPEWVAAQLVNLNTPEQWESLRREELPDFS